MMSKHDTLPFWQTRTGYLVLIGVVAAVAAGLTALLTNIFERKSEQRVPYVRVVEVGENDTDPAKWGKNWPAQYDSYQRTALPTKRRFGGHQARVVRRYRNRKSLVIRGSSVCLPAMRFRSTTAIAAGTRSCSSIKSTPKG
jgi:hypothetical protein